MTQANTVITMAESVISAYPDPDAILALSHDDMQAVNAEIERRLTSDIALINQLSSYIIDSGGKRLRPLSLLLSANATGYEGSDHIVLAAVIEFIHTATLLHDDVVDESELRRGQATANTVWGNAASVLVGDYLYSRAFEMMADTRRTRVMDIMSKTTNIIAEGEVMQLLNMHSADLTEQQYMETIKRKTARLFQSASQLGGVVAECDQRCEDALAAYGMHLGMAFQLVDDMLDYTAEAKQMGKNPGDDLAEGKATLPVIHALANSTNDKADKIKKAIETGDRSAIDTVVAVIQDADSITYTAHCAQQQSQQAIEALGALPDSEYKLALCGLAEFAVQRTH